MSDAELEDLMLVFDVDKSLTLDVVKLAPTPTCDTHSHAVCAPPLPTPSVTHHHSLDLLLPTPPEISTAVSPAPHSSARRQDEFETLVRVCLNIPMCPPCPPSPDRDTNAPDAVG